MSPAEYGSEYQAHLLDQYKLYVEMADRISQRRDQSNRFYAGLVSAIIAMLVLFGRFGESVIDWEITFLVSGVLGMTLSVIWFVNIHSYRMLNRAKYKVIHKIEEQLPFEGYKEEWAIARPPGGRASYIQLTRIERYVPLLVGLLFASIVGYASYSIVNGNSGC